MPVPSKPNSSRVHRNADFAWSQFAKDCLMNHYVLVVGSEAILNKNVNPEAGGDSQKLLFDLAIEELVAQYPGAKPDQQKRGNGFDGLCRVLNRNLVKESVLRTIENNDYYEQFDDEIEPTLMDLLRTRCFRMVITTAIDPYLEIAMEKVWGEGGFDIVEIDSAQKFKYTSYGEFGIMRPVLCYVFGKIDPTCSQRRFVLTENDAMEKVSSWFNQYDSNGFLKYVKQSQIVSVGCQFDDWMFRFFWFLLHGKVDSNADGQQVAVEIKQDEKLKNYLEQEKVKLFSDARSFMKEAGENIIKEADVNKLPRQENGVFISYAHEDRYIALPLFERLHSAGVNVWLDEDKLGGGDEYENRIRKAINSCKFFIAILSTQVKQDLENDNISQRWYPREWDWIQNRYEEEKNIAADGVPAFRVVPFVMGDYRFGERYHQQLPPCILEATAFEAAKDNVKELISRINRI